MSSFTLDSQASRVVFGAGSMVRLLDECLGCERAMLVSTPGRSGLADRAAAILGDRVAATFARAVVHVPEDVAIAARDAAREASVDCIVALGGGSAIGVAKAVALTSSIPIVAVPTTYGGSEMTPIYGLTRNGVKQTGRDARVQPRVVIYDPDLTLSLSRRTTACSGLNAMAHCIEALYAPDANPLTSSAALEGIGLLSRALPVLSASPSDRENRSIALQGAWLAGFALGGVQMALHHKLCHTLGGSFDLPHAETHAVLLPYTAAFNRSALPAAMVDAPSRLLQLARNIGAPMTLEEIGLRDEDIAQAASIATEREYPNPRPVAREAIEELLSAAWRGDAAYVTGRRATAD